MRKKPAFFKLLEVVFAQVFYSHILALFYVSGYFSVRKENCLM